MSPEVSWWPNPKTRLGQWLEVTAVSAVVGYVLGCLVGGTAGLAYAFNSASLARLWDFAESVIRPATVLSLIGAVGFGVIAGVAVGLSMTLDWLWSLLRPLQETRESQQGQAVVSNRYDAESVQKPNCGKGT